MVIEILKDAGTLISCQRTQILHQNNLTSLLITHYVWCSFHKLCCLVGSFDGIINFSLLANLLVTHKL